MEEISRLYRSLKAKQSETELQKQCVRYWRTMFRPDQYEYYLLYKVHNEGKKSKPQAIKDKALGIVAGAPDLNLDLPRHGYHGLRIEMKTQKGKQTEKQRMFQKSLESNGYLYRVVRTLEEFKELINWYCSIDK